MRVCLGVTVVASCMTAGVYIALYFSRSELAHCAFQGEPITIRLFETKEELYLWKPLLFLEGLLRTEEFHGQVRCGASIPSLIGTRNRDSSSLVAALGS